jgi:hypothetical protein
MRMLGYYGLGAAVSLPPAAIIQNFLDQLSQLSATVGDIGNFDVVVDNDPSRGISVDTGNRLVIIGYSQILTPLQNAVAAMGVNLSVNTITDSDLQQRVTAAQQSGTISNTYGGRGYGSTTSTLGKVSALQTLLSGLTGSLAGVTTQQKLMIGGIGAAIGAGVVGLTWLISAKSRRAG